MSKLVLILHGYIFSLWLLVIFFGKMTSYVYDFFVLRCREKQKESLKFCVACDKFAIQEPVIFANFVILGLDFFLYCDLKPKWYRNQTELNDIGLTRLLKSNMIKPYRPIMKRIFDFAIGFESIPSQPYTPRSKFISRCCKTFSLSVQLHRLWPNWFPAPLTTATL